MSVHDDTLEGLNEVLEYARGNTPLKTTAVEITDEEIKFYNIFNQLSETNKIKVMDYANALL